MPSTTASDDDEVEDSLMNLESAFVVKSTYKAVIGDLNAKLGLGEKAEGTGK